MKKVATWGENDMQGALHEREREREVGGRLKDLGLTALSPIHIGFLMPVLQNAGTTHVLYTLLVLAGIHVCCRDMCNMCCVCLHVHIPPVIPL